MKTTVTSTALCVTLLTLSFGVSAAVGHFPEQSGPNSVAPPVIPTANGTDVRNDATSGVMIIDDFTVNSPQTSFEPHFFGGWQSGTVGSISSVLLHWYDDNGGVPGTLLFSGVYDNSVPNGQGEFGTRLEGSGTRGFLDVSVPSLTPNDHSDYYQLSLTSSGPCCAPIVNGQTYWVGYMVTTTGGVWGTAVNEVIGGGSPGFGGSPAPQGIGPSTDGNAYWGLITDPNQAPTSWNQLLVNGNPVDVAMVLTPLPGAAIMFISGLAGLLGLSWRRKR